MPRSCFKKYSVSASALPLSVRQRYEAMKAKPLHIPNLDALIENFDKALSHPDAADLEQLKQAVK